MPIRPEDRWLYPIDWRELSRLVRFGRAGGRCERCRRPHGQEVVHLGDGRWWDAEAGRWRDGRGRGLRGLLPPEALAQVVAVALARREPGLGDPFDDPPGELLGSPAPRGLPRTRVALAACHLGHDPSRNGPRDLAALCQRCHMLHDAPEHRRRRRRRLRQERATGDLLQGG